MNNINPVRRLGRDFKTLPSRSLRKSSPSCKRPKVLGDSASRSESSNGVKINQTLDLKDTPCPINFVKTKLKLEEMKSGQVLEVFLDDGDPIKNVTASVKEEGHQILKVEQLGNHWRLIIKKI